MSVGMIGLDIGTTTISGVVLEKETGEQVDARTVRHDSYVNMGNAYQKEQDAEKIFLLCEEMLEHFRRGPCRIAGIGITGQMHGILYLNGEGRAVSKLVTWEDERGNLRYREGRTYSEYLTEAAGVRMATGYGLTTYFHDRENGRVPDGAAAFCTIGDYVAMRLCGLRRPILHPSNAASLGMFDLWKSEFSSEALEKAGIGGELLPEVCRGEGMIGESKEGTPVAVPIGDNQASFLGTIRGDGKILVNIGTGSQISVRCDDPVLSKTMEIRPYINGEYLLIGSGLCGGGAYQLLHGFLSGVLTSWEEWDCDGDPRAERAAGRMGGEEREENAGGRSGRLYGWMQELGEREYEKAGGLRVDTRFRGTRRNPGIRGSISSIDTENFTPGRLVLGFLHGICDEMFEYFQEIPEEMKEQEYITGSGNAIRHNELLKRIIQDTFSRRLVVPAYKEEAAWGAATLASRLI